jgi:hypothetical protein
MGNICAPPPEYQDSPLRLHNHPPETGLGCTFFLLHQEHAGAIRDRRGQWYRHVGRDPDFILSCWALDVEAGVGFRRFLIELNLLERNQKSLPSQVPGLLLALAYHPALVAGAVTDGNVPQALSNATPLPDGSGRSPFGGKLLYVTKHVVCGADQQ